MAEKKEVEPTAAVQKAEEVEKAKAASKKSKQEGTRKAGLYVCEGRSITTKNLGILDEYCELPAKEFNEVDLKRLKKLGAIEVQK